MKMFSWLALLLGMSLLPPPLGSQVVTITNPVPVANEWFGFATVALDADRMAICAPGTPDMETGLTRAGSVSIYTTNGVRSVPPLIWDGFIPELNTTAEFGISAARMGPDSLVVGAWLDSSTPFGFEGIAVLVQEAVDLQVVTVFTNHSGVQGSQFGISVAGVGPDRVVIGAPNDTSSEGVLRSGAAYLHATNGTLLATFDNPSANPFDSFGFPVATLGSDRILMGAQTDNDGTNVAGAAYVFDTNGVFLLSLENPDPPPATNEVLTTEALNNSDRFGAGLAGMGGETILVGAPALDRVYVYDRAGTLQNVLTNPVAGDPGDFGLVMEPVDDELVLISAMRSDIGATNAGVVYLYHINGTLLNTYTNPAPAVDDNFGLSITLVGQDRVLIGAWMDDTAGSNAGAAYLYAFDSPIPLLRISASPPGVTLSWPQTGVDFRPQRRLLLEGAPWEDLDVTAVVTNGENQVELAPTNRQRFFRLVTP